MRDIKIIAYGSVSEEDERLIENYLVDTRGMALKILSVDHVMEAKDRVIAEQNVLLKEYVDRIEELENDRTDD